MTFKERLIQEIEHTPDILLEQVFNFLRFLKTNPLIQISRFPSAEHQIQQLSGEGLTWFNEGAVELWVLALHLRRGQLGCPES